MDEIDLDDVVRWQFGKLVFFLVVIGLPPPVAAELLLERTSRCRAKAFPDVSFQRLS